MARKRKAKVAPPPELSDYDIGTPELHQREITELYGDNKKRRVRVVSRPLDYYYARGFIDRDSHSAGTQFCRLWSAGGGSPRYAAMDLMRVPGNGDSEHVSIMREKYRSALNSFRIEVTRRIVFDVVCVGEYADASMRRALIESVTGATNYRKRMDHLREGLDDLVRHFSKKAMHRGLDNRALEK